MKKFILSIFIFLSFIGITFLLISIDDEEQNYPYIDVHVDTIESNDMCGSKIEYTMYGSGYLDIGFTGSYIIDKKVLFGWKQIEVVSSAHTQMRTLYPYEGSICTTNALESGKYRITTIMHDISDHEEISATFKIE